MAVPNSKLCRGVGAGDHCLYQYEEFLLPVFVSMLLLLVLLLLLPSPFVLALALGKGKILLKSVVLFTRVI